MDSAAAIAYSQMAHGPSKATSFYIADEHLSQLRNLSVKRNLPVTELIRLALFEFANRRNAKLECSPACLASARTKISVRLPQDMLDVVRQRADRYKGPSESYVINSAICHFVEKLESIS